jgi:uncharacterized membrane protein
MSPPEADAAALAPAEQRHEPRWPASLAIVAALVLYVTLPDKFVLGPRYLIPGLEGALVVALTVTAPHRRWDESAARRIAAVVLIVIVNVANVTSLGFLVHELLNGGKPTGNQLIFSAVQIWLTNVIVFSLWYWEVDRGGPGRRARRDESRPDFLYPQMVNPEVADRDWSPSYLDYLYLSFTNATAFSPTDTMPLSPMAKVLMLVESLASFVTVAVVAARAVNILT